MHILDKLLYEWNTFWKMLYENAHRVQVLVHVVQLPLLFSLDQQFSMLDWASMHVWVWFCFYVAPALGCLNESHDFRRDGRFSSRAAPKEKKKTRAVRERHCHSSLFARSVALPQPTAAVSTDPGEPSVSTSPPPHSRRTGHRSAA
jgi:hypothetical protein